MSGERPRNLPCRVGEWIRERTGAETRHFRRTAVGVFLWSVAVVAVGGTGPEGVMTPADVAGAGGVVLALVTYAVGKESEEPPRCPGCRTPVQPDPANYCRRCGAKLYPDEWPEQPTTETEVARGRRQ